MNKLKNLAEIFRKREILSFSSISKDQKENSLENSFKISSYVGIDPTSSKIHLGNYLQIITNARGAFNNIDQIFLIGGATGKIGDPSGKSVERILLEEQQLNFNKNNMQNSLNIIVTNLYNYLERKYNGNYKFVDNSEFYKGIEFLDFFSNYGKYFRVNNMLRKESVSKRLQSDSGLSLLEFMYSVFQAFDFWILFKNENCVLQIGGSDQLGNIQAGTEFIDKIIFNPNQLISSEIKSLHKTIGCHCLTTNLLLNPNGEKFGKSNGNAIWVDPNNEDLLLNLYQFLINQPDNMIYTLFMQFTFLEESEIDNIIKIHNEDLELKFGQKKLSETILEQITNDEILVKKVMNYSNYFKYNADFLKNKDKEFINEYFGGLIKVYNMNKSDYDNNLINIIYNNGKTNLSRKEIKNYIKKGNVQINGKISNINTSLEMIEPISEIYYIFKITKKIFFTLKIS